MSNNPKNNSQGKGFWSKQPVTKTEVSLNLNQKESRVTSQIVLPDNLEFSTAVANDYSRIYEFLSRNYVESDNKQFRLRYSLQFLRREFFEKSEWCVMVVRPVDKSVENEGRVLCADGTKEILGFLCAKPIVLNINKKYIIRKDADQENTDEMGDESIFKSEKFGAVNFFCVDPSLRHTGVSNLLIKEIQRIITGQSIYHAIFTGSTDLGFSFSRVRYHHKIIDTDYLLRANYIHFNVNYTYEGKENIIREYKTEDFESIREIYLRELINKQDNSDKQNKSETRNNGETGGIAIYEDIDRKSLEKILVDRSTGEILQYGMGSQENISDSQEWLDPNIRVFVYPATGKILGFCSYYVVDSLSTALNEPIRSAYLKHIHGSDKKLILSALTDKLYKSGIHVFNGVDIEDRRDLLRKIGALEGTGYLYYYVFNYGIKNMKNENIGFLLF